MITYNSLAFQMDFFFFYKSAGIPLWFTVPPINDIEKYFVLGNNDYLKLVKMKDLKFFLCILILNVNLYSRYFVKRKMS